MKSRCLLCSRHRLFTYQAYVREIDKNPTGQITPESGELPATPDPRSALYTPEPGELTREGNHLPTPYILTRGVGDLESVPDTRSGGSVLKAPQRRRGGTPPLRVFWSPSQTTNPFLGQQPDGPNNVRAAPEQSHPQGGSEQTRQHQQEAVHAALRQVGCD